MSLRNQRNTNDDSDTDWDSIYDEQEHRDLVDGDGAAADNNEDDDASRPSKASEAAHERQRSVATATDMGTSQASSSSSPPSRQQSRQTTLATGASPSWVDESTPLIDTDAPPPAYSDIAGNRFEFGQASSRDLWHSRRAGDGDDDDDGGEAGRTDYTDPVKRRRGPRRSHKVLNLALIVLSIMLIAVSCTTTLRDRHNGGYDDGGDDDGNGNHRGSDGHVHDGHGVLPSPPELPSNDTWRKTPLGDDYCRFESYSLNLFFSFPSPPKFSFVEFVEQHGNLVRRVDGVVKVTAAPANQQAAIVVGVWIAATDGYEVETVDMRQTDESLSMKDLTLGTKDQDRRSSSGGWTGPCLAIYVTLSVKSGIELSDLEIATAHLNLIVDPSLHTKTNTNKGLSIRDKTEFTTIAGDVSVPYWSSRETIIDVISGSVHGAFALQDLLSIKTRSGGIDIDVDPRPGDPTSPRPAELTAESVSGDIEVRFPISNTTTATTANHNDGGADVLYIPTREYRTRTETKSGAISGTYILGLTSTFKSVSGSITATLLPFYHSAPSRASGLRTETTSGTTRINLLAPYLAKTESRSGDEAEAAEAEAEQAGIRRLRSSHTSVSARLDIVYPQAWVGRLTGASTSGRITVRGKDVKVVGGTERPGRKSVSAVKGADDDGGAASEMTLFSISGNQNVVIGDLY